MINNFLEKHNLKSPENKILVGFSGGMDSLCLLFMLKNLSKEYNFFVAAIHVNHQWRGYESIDDENFCVEFCKENEIDVFVERLEKGLPQTELVAREKRYEVFNKVAIENNFNVLMTAHTKSDQVETVLYRIIKGTGHKGLGGIPEKRIQQKGPTVYRPLITFSREELEGFASENNLQARNDSSNFVQTYLRNKIRHSLLPQLKEYNSSIDEAIIRLSEISKQNEDLVEYFLEETINKLFEDRFILDLKRFIALKEFIKPRIIIKLLNDADVEYDYKFINEILVFINSIEKTRSGKLFSLNADKFIKVTDKNIKIISQFALKPVETIEKVIIPGETIHKELNVKLKITEINLENVAKPIYPPSDALKAYVNLSKIDTDLYLRSRRQGDIITPLGMKGKMKLKKYLIERKVPRENKNLVPLLADENEVLWVVGVGLNDKIKVIDLPTHVVEIEKDVE